MNPEFGCDLKKVLFENITDDIDELINNLIKTNTYIFIPEISILDIIIDKNGRDENKIQITVNYRIKISGNTEQITVQFI